MTEMIAWLRAQIEADKAAAEAFTKSAKADTADGYHLVTRLQRADGEWKFAPHITEYLARHEPRDVIADCNAKLAILDEHFGFLIPKGNPDRACRICSDRRADDGPLSSDDRWVRLEPTPCPTVRLLAQGYRHRDGWREEWAA